MDHWLVWLKRYGYVALFFGTFLGGEECLILAAFLSGFGYFDLPWVIVIAALGGSFGDQFYYYLARDRAIRLIEKSPRLSRLYPKARALVEKYGVLTVSLSRFLAGFRIMIPVICATGRMPALKYSLLSLTSAGLWATFFGLTAHFSGPIIFYRIKQFTRRWYWLVIFSVLTILSLYLVLRRIKGNCVRPNSSKLS